MSVLPFPARLGFGVEVLVQAEAVRLTADTDGGFREQLRSRGYQGNRQGRLFPGDVWPGAPIGVDWDPGPRGYRLDPPRADGESPVRVRRLLREKPTRAVVIGITDRVEGTLIAGTLRAPGRTIRVLELALHVPSGRAKVILAHPRDVQPVPVQGPRR